MNAIPNRMTLQQLIDSDADTVAKLPVDMLILLQDEISAKADKIKKATAKLALGLDTRYAKRFAAARKAKPTGVLHIEDSGITVDQDVSKTVSYDQEALSKVLDSMEEGWAHYGKVAITVEERVYAAAPPSVQKLIDPTRTVKPGAAKYKLVVKDAGK